MTGYTGGILRVNLTTGLVSKEQLDVEWAGKYIGGRGFNSRVLYDSLKPGADPLGPVNLIVISAGPCCGTEVPGSQRFTVSAKSPLSGFLGDSNSGGSLGLKLKQAGYDMLVIEGRAPRLVYLYIDDQHIELKPAEHLAGKTTRETTKSIMREVGDPEIAVISIGVAGEKQVRFASIIADFGRGLGRTGLGAVFGSKNLKAVAARGSRSIRVADHEKLAQLAADHRNAWRRRAEAKNMRFEYGPYGGWKRYRDFGMIGVRNFQQGTFEDWKLMEPEWVKNCFKQKACYSCPAGCSRMYVLSNGPWSGTFGHAPELMAPADFGPRLGNGDLGVVLKAATLCDLYGIDYVDTSGVIGFAMECYQRGILTEKDTGGLKLEWGSGDAILGLIEQIAHREGIGEVLSRGLVGAAREIGRGSEEYALHVKGLALVFRNPRAAKTWGLGFAVSSRGACHVRAHAPESYALEFWDSALHEALKKYRDPLNPTTEEGKAEINTWYEDLHAFKNAMQICIFSLYSWMGSMPTLMAGFFNSVTGTRKDEAELMRDGERIVNLERAFNLREGLSHLDDTLPERMLKEALPDGPAKGQVIDIEPMVKEYYEFRGWSRESGYPKREKLAEIGLEDLIGDLAEMGRLG